MAAKKTAKKKRLVLLDAHAIIHRAYHALPDFTSSTGEPTGALYGISAMLLKIVQELNPDYIVAAYDLPEPTHRHEAFGEYKAGRDKSDEALTHQIERSRDLFEAFNIPIYERGGFEADDILGTIVESQKKKKSLEIIIASGDMDTLQLVRGKDVRVYTLRKGIKDTIIYDEKAVEERFGFGPTLLPDYKGLRGDPSDNIPGIPGIGEKTATALITGFGGIDDIYKRLTKGDEPFLEKGIKPRIVNLLKEYKDEAHFSKMLGEIRNDAPITFTLPKTDWDKGLDPEKVLVLFSELGFKTLSERVKSLFGLTQKEDPKDAHKKEKGESISDEQLEKLGIALWVLNSEYTNPSKDDILSYTNTPSFRKAEKHIMSELKRQELTHVYENIELPLIPIVKNMTDRGIKVDLTYLKKLSKKYHTELDAVSKKIYKHAGSEFNINSPKQLGEILFDTLGLALKAKTASGKRSTRESALIGLRKEHPIIDEILEYREIKKLLSTYIDNLPHMVSPQDKRLHARFLQAGTTTGRMASQNPNLQNIPIRSDRGKVIRNAFVAEKGYKLLKLDYSQIELRIAAVLAEETAMLDAFKAGEDIHSAVAQEVFGKKGGAARRTAKIINFGLLYGMGVVALSKTLGTKRAEAQKFLDEYKTAFPKLISYMDDIKLSAHKNGYTETMFGRRRYFPGLASHLPYVRAEAERMAINAPIQGTSADIIKIAMARVNEWIQKEKQQDNIFLILQVHDELVYEVKESEAENAVKHIADIMESVVSPKEAHGVTFHVDAAVGDNWGEMEEVQ